MLDPRSEVMAIVPARGGSKGIPRKNLADVGGLPLLGWTLTSLIQARTPMRVVVTTDDQEIANFSAGYGVEVRDRPTGLASDDASTESAVLDVLSNIPGRDSCETVLLLQATSPLRREESVDRFLKDFESSKCDSLVAVVESSPFLWRGPLDSPTPMFVATERPRRQDFDEHWTTYRECGSMYAFKRLGFMEAKNRIFGNPRVFVLDQFEGLDIDTPEDLALVGMIVGSGLWTAPTP